MPPFPLNLIDELGETGSYIVYLLIGFAFGYVLEIAGFGNSKKLAAQFYFSDMTVFKVMFTAILTAMVLIFMATAVGLLDYNLIWVNPTYLWPGIVGGLVMGVGFIVGGFCPGTSLVAAATLKLDGLFFALGAFFGIFLFGETVGWFEDFWYSSYEGRLTVPEFLGMSPGATVLMIVVLAMLAFFGAEWAERFFGGSPATPKWRYSAAGVFVLAAVGVFIIGQPTTDDRWDWVADEKETQLANREVQIEPAELLSLMHDHKIKLAMLDVRGEADYNLFHILDAQHVPANTIPDQLDEFLEAPANTVFVVMSNDEKVATEVWKTMVAESVPNVYILEGGLNNWLSIFSDPEGKPCTVCPSHADELLHFTFPAALGSRYPAANPSQDVFQFEFTPKVKLQTKGGLSGGGCG